MGMGLYFMRHDTSGRYDDEYERRRRREERMEKARIEHEAKLKREIARPPKHDKLRGPYGKRK